jgi:hypothetical protein
LKDRLVQAGKCLEGVLWNDVEYKSITFAFLCDFVNR